MKLSKTGIIADILWYEIKNHAKNVELDAFVVMPNHIHGIIILNSNNIVDETNVNKNVDVDANVETRHALSLQQNHQPPLTIGQKRFQNQGKNSLSSIIGGYKSAVTRHARRLRFVFAWQSRFHDHIIRDATSYQRIKNYIINNPENRDNDKFR